MHRLIKLSLTVVMCLGIIVLLSMYKMEWFQKEINAS